MPYNNVNAAGRGRCAALEYFLEDTNMQMFEKDDEDILKTENLIWDNLVEGSNEMDYELISKHFSKKMLEDADESNLKRQWETNDVLSSLSTRREYLGSLRRGRFVTILWKQLSFRVQGDYLARLVPGTEDEEVKIFGATIT